MKIAGFNNFLLMIGYQPQLKDILVTEIPQGKWNFLDAQNFIFVRGILALNNPKIIFLNFLKQ